MLGAEEIILPIEKAQLEHWLACFKIGDPIKSFFAPRFSLYFNHSGEVPYVSLQINTPDAYGIAGRIQVSVTRALQPQHVASEQAFGYLLREMLHYMMKHEVDEAIMVNGDRIFDPHQGELR